MLKREIKLFLFLLIMSYSFLSNAGYTDADIFAERVINSNKLSSVVLDFSTNNSVNSGFTKNLFHSSAIEPGGFDVASIRFKSKSNVPLKYNFNIKKTRGDDILCNNLKLKVFNSNFFPVYLGSLMDFSKNDKLSSDEVNDYIFYLSLDKNDKEIKNKLCEFNIDIKTYRDNPNEEDAIFAQRSLSNIVSSGDW
ncbi:hypothetical protein K9M50_03485 [Patescibacteria group bacterium]|nr:hypothetical protein [Patescibacteria group bacterium]